jgi:crotonobetaine/carnitine-CoA ligase
MAVASEWGEDEVKIMVVPATGRAIDPAQLVEFLAPLMPAFALPRFVEIAAALPDRQASARRRAAAAGPGVWDREKA